MFQGTHIFWTLLVFQLQKQFLRNPVYTTYLSVKNILGQLTYTNLIKKGILGQIYGVMGGISRNDTSIQNQSVSLGPGYSIAGPTSY